MDPELLNWLKEDSGRTFESPRKDVFGSNPQDLTIRYVDEEDKLVRISFSEKKTLARPLYFWMFDRTLEHLKRNPEAAYPIGARLQPPYPKESVEEDIWREPMLYSSPYKSSPHVLDILALAGFVKFQKTRSRDTNRQVQGAKYSRGPPPPPKEQEPPTPPLAPRDPKKEFLEKHHNSIIKWTETNKVNIVRSRLDYRWKKHTRYQCERSRNMVSKAITMSRIRNQGAVDLRTLDQVMEWGFNRKYPDRDPEKALKTTLEAFQYLDRGDIRNAALTLLKVNGLGISRVSKILGLSDQENLCIYDSRVGYALGELTHDGERLFKIPPSQSRSGDSNIECEEWADLYEKLIWVVDVIRDYLKEQGCTYRSADVEMALFMMGK